MCIACAIREAARQDGRQAKIPAPILTGREAVRFLVNEKQTSVVHVRTAGGSLLFLTGNPQDKLCIEITNHGSNPILAVIALNGLSVLSGKPATRDDDAILVLPRTTCKIGQWFDATPLELFGAPRGYDRHIIPMGTLGVYTYEVDEKSATDQIDVSKLFGGNIFEALSGLTGQPTPSQSRTGAWQTLRTGSPVSAAQLPRRYPAGQQIEIRYDTFAQLTERGLNPPSTPSEELDSWWTNSAFPADDRSYLGGNPTTHADRDIPSHRDRRTGWQPERVRESV